MEGRKKRGTYGNANLSGVSPSQRGGHIRTTQQCPVSGQRTCQRQANCAIILNKKDGHAQARLLDVSSPVGLVRWGPYFLGDDVVHGRGNDVQKPKRLLTIVRRIDGVDASVVDGGPRGHQRIVPSGHVPDQIDVSNIHLEQRFYEKRRISPAEHLCQESLAADKGDRCVGLVLVAIRVRPGWMWSWDTCVVRHGLVSSKGGAIQIAGL